MDGVVVRRATDADASAVIDVLERALAEDPFVRWLTDARRQAIRRYLGLMVRRIALPKGIVDVACVGGQIASAAVWAPPRTFELSPAESLRLLPTMIRIIGALRFSRVALVLDEIERARPPEPRWLLTLLGTVPERRRRGLASSVLAPALTRCDASGQVAVCETSDSANLSFYARHGFRLTAQRTLGADGPPSYTLRRDPRVPGA